MTEVTRSQDMVDDNNEEIFLKKLEKFFEGYFECLNFRDFTGGINPRDIKSLGGPTIRGMIMFLVENKISRAIGYTEKAFFLTKERDCPEKECLDLLSYLSSLLGSSGIEEKPCLPVFRVREKHFKRGVDVMVYFKGSWIPGTVTMPSKPAIERGHIWSPQTGIHQADVIRLRPPLQVEIKGDEPQIIEVVHCDASIFRKDEYDYIISGKDPEFIQLLQKNIKEYGYGFLAVYNKSRMVQNLAMAELVRLSADPTNKYYHFVEKNEKLMIMWRDKWTRAVIYSPEVDDKPAIIEMEGDEPQIIPLTTGVIAVPQDVWDKLNLEGKISPEMVAEN